MKVIVWDNDDTRIGLLCELAHERIEEEIRSEQNPRSSYIEENQDGTKYTENGQYIFDTHYDYYEGILSKYAISTNSSQFSDHERI